MPKILTEKDIKNVLHSIEVVNETNVTGEIEGGCLNSTNLSNGYRVVLTIDVLSENKKLLHISVSKPDGYTDKDIAQQIADDIIGEGSTMIGPRYVNNVIHFLKLEDETTMTELMKDVNIRL